MIYEFAQSKFLHAPDLMMVKDSVARVGEGRQKNGSLGVTIWQGNLFLAWAVRNGERCWLLDFPPIYCSVLEINDIKAELPS
jgi:hypothetical protein